jgi:phosphate transport system substrate-binding protein
VTIDGASPTAADVSGGKYPFFAHEHMYTKGAGSPLAQAFIAFILSSQFQTTEVSTLGFLPLSTTSAQAAVDS